MKRQRRHLRRRRRFDEGKRDVIYYDIEGLDIVGIDGKGKVKRYYEEELEGVEVVDASYKSVSGKILMSLEAYSNHHFDTKEEKDEAAYITTEEDEEHFDTAMVSFLNPNGVGCVRVKPEVWSKPFYLAYKGDHYEYERRYDWMVHETSNAVAEIMNRFY